MARRQWFAVSVDVFDSDLGVDIRDEFGTTGLCMWIGFLAACKRNSVPGKIRYSSDAECLSLMGLPALELVDEEGEPFKLDDFWSFLGQRKQTKVTRSKRLVDVSATRWEQWQDDARLARERERKRRSRAESDRTDGGHDADEKRTDNDQDHDTTTTATDGTGSDPFDDFWSAYPKKESKRAARKAWTAALKRAEGPEEIIDGARRYAENIEAHKTERRFIAQPTTWLNGDRWGDELAWPQQADGGFSYR